MKKLIFLTLFSLIGCTTADTPQETEPTPPIVDLDAEVSDSSGNIPVTVPEPPTPAELVLLNNSEKLNSCYKITVFLDKKQNNMCYIAVSQCSNGVPTMSCIKL